MTVLLAVPGLPWLAAIAARLAGRRGDHWAGPALIIACAGSLLLVLFLPAGNLSASWLSSGPVALSLELRLDPLSRLLGMLVAAIALPVSVFALGYIEHARSSFFASLALFVGSMEALLLASSFPALFAAWELVGLGSFLLIGFYGRGAAAVEAAVQAFLTTRITDFALLLAWLLLALTSGSAMLDAAPSGKAAGAVALLVAIGVLGKGAQLPFSAWLPAAMVAPTPVSALLHSSTMVAAGVMLLLKLWPLMAASPAALYLLIAVGGLSALAGSLIATAESDLKRLFAWSTIAQIGEMMVTLGLGGPFAATLHLVAHACFKATLFLVSGSLQKRAGSTELPRIAGMLRALPWSGAAFAVGALALAGIPPLAGYWSDEAILGTASHTTLAWLFPLLAALAGLYIGRASGILLSPHPGRTTDATMPTRTMTGAAVAIGVAAAAAGGLLAGPYRSVLPFLSPPTAPAALRFSEIGLAVLGLAGGWWAGARAVEPLGQWPKHLAAGLDHVTRRLAIAALSLGRSLESSETALASSADGIVRGLLATANAGRAIEGGLVASTDRGGVTVEASGDWIRRAQSGRVPFYLLVLLIWIAFALAAAFLLGRSG